MPTRSSPKAEAPPPRLFAGTSGWSYEAWKGPFYPEDLRARDMLAFYAATLPCVEVNQTFYRMPKPEVLEGWAAQVPEGFRFALKVSQRITHRKRLRDVGEETEWLLRGAAALGPRLGALLVQTPPNLARDLERFDAFLALLPPGTRAAFELRHPSWSDDAVFGRLRERGFAWVAADVDDAPPPPLVATAPFAYLRLRRTAYGPDDLARWLDAIRASGAREALVFFKHEDEGAAPRLARELLALAGAGRAPLATPAPRRGAGARGASPEAS
jgi:uncharacterized protein YecE (DUF72 family)